MAKLNRLTATSTNALATKFKPTSVIPADNVQDAIEYVWNNVNGGVSGSYAPTSEEYVTSSAASGLSAERVLTDTGTITWDAGTASQIKANWQHLGLQSLSDPGADALFAWDNTLNTAVFVQGGAGITVSATDIAITDAHLAGLMDLDPIAGSMVYYTGTNTPAALATTSFGRDLLTKNDASEVRQAIGVQTADDDLDELADIDGATGDFIVWDQNWKGTSGTEARTYMGVNVLEGIDDVDPTGKIAGSTLVYNSVSQTWTMQPIGSYSSGVGVISDNQIPVYDAATTLLQGDSKFTYDSDTDTLTMTDGGDDYLSFQVQDNVNNVSAVIQTNNWLNIELDPTNSFWNSRLNVIDAGTTLLSLNSTALEVNRKILATAAGGIEASGGDIYVNRTGDAANAVASLHCDDGYLSRLNLMEDGGVNGGWLEYGGASNIIRLGARQSSIDYTIMTASRSTRNVEFSADVTLVDGQLTVNSPGANGGRDSDIWVEGSTGTGSIGLSSNNGGTDANDWDFFASGANLALRAVNDANTASSPVFTVYRTGTTVDSFVIGSDVQLDRVLTFNSTSNPQIAMGAGDYWQYNSGSDLLEWISGGATRHQLAQSHMRVGMTRTDNSPSWKVLTIGQDDKVGFGLQSNGDPLINFDDFDWLEYDQANNVYQFYIGNSIQMSLSSSILSLAGPSLYMNSGSVYLDTDDDTRLYSPGDDIVQLVLGGTARMYWGPTSTISYNSIIPGTDNTYNLGSGGNQWNNLYLGDYGNIVFNSARSIVDDTVDLNINDYTALNINDGANIEGDSGSDTMGKLEGFAVIPKGYSGGKGIDFRLDTSDVYYMFDRLTPTLTVNAGTITESQIAPMFGYTNGYTNLNTYKDGSNNIQFTITDIAISNSSNTNWACYVLFHSAGGAVTTITVEALEGDSTTWTTLYTGPGADFIAPQDYTVFTTGVLRGLRYTFSGITGNSYLKMLGVTSRTSPSYTWNLMKDGGQIYGNLDWYDSGSLTTRMYQSGYLDMGNDVDLGEFNKLILDNDNDTYITATGDDHIKFYIAGAEDFFMDPDEFRPNGSGVAALGGASHRWGTIFGNYGNFAQYVDASYFLANSTGTNTDPGSDNAYFSGFGVLGNRGAMYLTNYNASGSVNVCISGGHAANIKQTWTATTTTIYEPLTVQDNIITTAGDVEVNRVGDATTAFMRLDKDSSQNATIEFQTGGLNDFAILGSVGSGDSRDFYISRYVAGVWQDNPLTIDNGSGDVTIANDLHADAYIKLNEVDSRIAFDTDEDTYVYAVADDTLRFYVGAAHTLQLTQNYATVLGSLDVDGGHLQIDRTGDSIASLMYIDADDGYDRGIFFRTGTTSRWRLTSNGSHDFELERYNSSGVFQDNAIHISGSTGEVTIANELDVQDSVNFRANSFLNGNNLYLDSDDNSYFSTGVDDQLDLYLGGLLQVRYTMSAVNFLNNSVTTTNNINTTGGYFYVNRIGGAAEANMYFSADAGQRASIVLREGSTTQWLVHKESNNNFEIERYVGGVYQDAPLEIANSTGDVTIANDLDVEGAITVGTGSTVTPLGNADDLVIDTGANDVGISINSGVGGAGRINFGDSADADSGQIQYSHGSLSMFFLVEGATQLQLSGSTANFQDNTVTTSGQIATTGSSIRINRVGDSNDAWSYLDADAGQHRNIGFRTGTSNRWVIRANSTAESGSDVGSNFQIRRFDDSGTVIDSAIEITRSTGNVNINHALTVGEEIDAASWVGSSATGALGIPGGSTAQRETPGTYGFRYNTTLASFEGYNGSTWGDIGGGGGGGLSAGTDSLFRMHKRQCRETVTLWENNTAFTTDYATDDKLDATSHPFSDGDMVYVESTGTLPTGLSEDTAYYVINSTANDFELSTTFGGSAVDINTSNGSGTHTIYEPVVSITGTMDVESDGEVIVKSGSEWIIVG